MEHLDLPEAGFLIQRAGLLPGVGACGRRLPVFFGCHHGALAHDLIAVEGVLKVGLRVKTRV
jgi:hypothetical protein